VKRFYASKAMLKAINSSLLIFLALLTSSCSSLWLHREQTVDSALANGAITNNSKIETVPKEQYEELSRKYQELLIQAKSIKTNEVVTEAQANHANKDEQQKPVVAEATMIDPSELVNKIDKAIPDTTPVIGVEALASQEKGPAVPNSMGVKTVMNSDEIDDQIVRIREAQELIRANKFEAALIILKELEGSKEKQVVVRSKMMLGDLLFNQGEFDLASQVYEEIIGKYAFSGFVIKALGKLIVCSEKLKQEQKQAKYYSLLHDFFEAT